MMYNSFFKKENNMSIEAPSISNQITDTVDHSKIEKKAKKRTTPFPSFPTAEAELQNLRERNELNLREIILKHEGVTSSKKS